MSLISFPGQALLHEVVRYIEVEEDEYPKYLLCNEYEKYLFISS